MVDVERKKKEKRKANKDFDEFLDEGNIKERENKKKKKEQKQSEDDDI